MRCTEPHRWRTALPARNASTWASWANWATWACVVLLAGCSAPNPRPPSASLPAPATPPAAAVPAPGDPVPPPVLGRVNLPPPGAPRTALELRRQMAHRLVQAHPEASYLSRAPDRLLAIPVLEVELNADGSVRRINVLRHPKTGSQATQLAIDAVHRAAPYGNVSHLPRPWKVVETFLFDDQLRFKPHTLDMQ